MIIIEAASWEKESLLHMQTAQVQARLRMRAVSSEPMLFAHIRCRPRFSSQRTRRVALLEGWVCELKDCFNGKFEEHFSCDAAHRNV